jgi:hypothetical protein
MEKTLLGRLVRVGCMFAVSVISAKALNAQEQSLGKFTFGAGGVDVSLEITYDREHNTVSTRGTVAGHTLSRHSITGERLYGSVYQFATKDIFEVAGQQVAGLKMNIVLDVDNATLVGSCFQVGFHDEDLFQNRLIWRTVLRKHWPDALTKEAKKGGPLPIDEDTSEVTIRPTAGHFPDYYLDFESDHPVEESGRFHFSRNLILNKQKASGGIWCLAKTGTGWLIRVHAHSDFEGWYLDFDNQAPAKKSGGYTSAHNLLLTQERGAGGYWKITDKKEKGFTIQATAGEFEGFYLDFDNSAPVEHSGGFDFSRNLLLTKELASGCYWHIEVDD